MKKINYIPWIAAAGLAASLAIALPAFAQTSVGASAGVNVQLQGGVHNGANGGMRRGMMPGIFGTVSAVNGTTITVTSKMMRPMPESEGGTGVATSTVIDANPTVYTVDASNAQIYKGTATTTVSVSSIAIGDTVMVQGTVNGTNVTATVIRDGFFMNGGRKMPWGGKGEFGANGSSTPVSPIAGNGEPVVGGSITAINGETITVTNASNVTYTINASGATILKDGTSTAISNLTTGDEVIVQGAVSGTSVTASSIIDQGVKNGNGNSTSTTPSHGGGMSFGFLSSIGGFFKHLFGF